MGKNIVIDVRMSSHSGIGTYISSLLPLIVGYLPNHQFLLLGRCNSELAGRLAGAGNVDFVDCRSEIYSIGEQIMLPLKTPPRTDLFWSPHFNVPLFHRGPLLVTIHDVAHLALKDIFRGVHKRAYAKLMLEGALKKADRIICVSEFTKSELLKYTRVSPNKLVLLREGVDEKWTVPSARSVPRERPYFLFVGNVKPHKNLERLLAAFGCMIDRVPHDLVIVGKKDGFLTDNNQVFSLAKSLGDRVVFTGYLEEDLLKAHLKYATALCVPSIYEGFGLPALEAMAAGCPVIAARAASLPEVCGDAALYVDPYSVEDIARGMLRIAHEDATRVQLLEAGRRQVARMTWEACARGTVSVIESTLASNSQPE